MTSQFQQWLWLNITKSHIQVLETLLLANSLTYWGRVTHICVNKLTIIGSDNGLSPDRRQAIIWTNDGLLLIGPLGTDFSGILIEILTFSSKKMRLKVSSAKRRTFCLGLNVLSCTKRHSRQRDRIVKKYFFLIFLNFLDFLKLFWCPPYKKNFLDCEKGMGRTFLNKKNDWEWFS